MKLLPVVFTLAAGAVIGACIAGGYSHPDCPAATDACATNTWTCAIRRIEAKHGACTVDGDCTLIAMGRNCQNYGTCSQAPVATAEVGPFLEEVNAELRRYCDTSGCDNGVKFCGVPVQKAVCVKGQCNVATPNDPQQDYDYPGCFSSPQSYSCANDRIYRCAIDTIREKYDQCSTAADCVRVELDECVSSGEPHFVSASGRTQFEAEAAREMARYCDGGLCRSHADAGAGWAPACVGGHCVATRDGG